MTQLTEEFGQERMNLAEFADFAPGWAQHRRSRLLNRSTVDAAGSEEGEGVFAKACHHGSNRAP